MTLAGIAHRSRIGTRTLPAHVLKCPAGKTEKHETIDRPLFKRMETGPHGVLVMRRFKAVPMPDDVIESNDILALAGSVLDLARFVGDNP